MGVQKLEQLEDPTKKYEFKSEKVHFDDPSQLIPTYFRFYSGMT